MLNFWDAPHAITTEPSGEIEPPAPADAETLYGPSATNVASIGYIGARNRLLAEARGEFALSLDDDAEIVGPGFVPVIRRHFAANPRCGRM